MSGPAGEDRRAEEDAVVPVMKRRFAQRVGSKEAVALVICYRKQR